jgi:hypothetical protein
MKVLILVLALVAVAICVRVDLSAPALDKSMIEELNKDAAMTWKAGENEFFSGKSLGEVKSMLISRDYFAKDANEQVPVLLHPAANAPDTFDSRKQWPTCIHAIRNQARCGSCW